MPEPSIQAQSILSADPVPTKKRKSVKKRKGKDSTGESGSIYKTTQPKRNSIASQSRSHKKSSMQVQKEEPK